MTKTKPKIYKKNGLWRSCAALLTLENFSQAYIDNIEAIGFCGRMNADESIKHNNTYIYKKQKPIDIAPLATQYGLIYTLS